MDKKQALVDNLFSVIEQLQDEKYEVIDYNSKIHGKTESDATRTMSIFIDYKIKHHEPDG